MRIYTYVNDNKTYTREEIEELANGQDIEEFINNYVRAEIGRYYYVTFTFGHGFTDLPYNEDDSDVVFTYKVDEKGMLFATEEEAIQRAKQLNEMLWK